MVKAKKHLGQHFLTDKNIAHKIVANLQPIHNNVLEVGSGTGVLTSIMVEEHDYNLFAMDIDSESIDYLKNRLPQIADHILFQDFLKADFSEIFKDSFSVIGNFPYNISSQIIFKIIDNRNQIPEMVGMFQKEVAERVAAHPGNKTYGILSVFTQAYFDVKYLFTVHEHVFSPAPKVKSAVIKLQRKENYNLPCDEKLFARIVKAGFNQRRKTLRNSIKQLLPENFGEHPVLTKRPEQLSVEEFYELTNLISR